MTLSTVSRLKRLQKMFSKFKIEGCVIENPVDLFYLTGLSFSEGTLVIGQTLAKLFVDGRYIEMAKKSADLPVSLKEEGKIEAFLEKLKITKMGFDTTWTTYDRYLSLKKLGSVKGVERPLKPLRILKDTRELMAIRKSAELNWKGFREIPKFLKEGVTEQEVARKFELFCLEHGASGLAFPSIIAFGSNGAYPHHMPTRRKLKKGDAVLVDCGVVFDGYVSDMTRILFFGTPKPAMRVLYNLVTEAHKVALSLAEVGTPLGNLDGAVRKMFAKEKMLRFYPHSLGHGLGLEVHESPRLSWKGKDRQLKIEENMVFTIEPGLYLPGVGGMRYEDTVIAHSKGPEVLYPRLEIEDVILFV